MILYLIYRGGQAGQHNELTTEIGIEKRYFRFVHPKEQIQRRHAEKEQNGYRHGRNTPGQNRSYLRAAFILFQRVTKRRREKTDAEAHRDGKDAEKRGGVSCGEQ